MKLLLAVSQSPVLEILLKWTVLLALGWAAHGLLRSKDARWRLILWRGIFCFGLALPVVQLFPVSVVQIPIHDYADQAPETSAAVPTGVARDTMQAQIKQPIMVTVPAPVETAVDTAIQPVNKGSATIPWRTILITIWAVGGVYGAIRLVRLMVQLSVLKRNARPAGSAIETLAREILQRLRVRRVAQVLVSDSSVSPFVFGVFKPTIMLPGKLVESLSEAEAAALLGHEIAHLRRNDLFWCVGWRWMKAVFWFHPLVWKIPAAHNLACEEEADRLASCQMGELASYPRILAQLALRVLDIPKVETQLTANGTAQITQRLRYLGLNLGTWTRKHTYAAFGIVLALVLVSAGCKLSGTNDGDKAGNDATIVPDAGANGQTFKWSGKIIDVTGKPVSGATVEHWRYEGALYPPHDPKLKKQTLTGADGTFEFQVSQEYGFLLARKTGMAPAWQLLNYMKDSVPATKQTMVMTPPGTLAGTVADESNIPVTNAEVYVVVAVLDAAGVDDNRPVNYLDGKLAHDCFVALTDAAGRFRIENFPTNASAGLAIKLPGKALRLGPSEPANSNTARYRAGQKDIQLRVEMVGSIEGKVICGETNQTLPHALLQLRTDGPHDFVTDGFLPVQQANADGTFRINDVPAGAYHLQATFGTNVPSDWVAEHVAVSVEAGQTNRGLEVTARHGGLLEVVVLGKKDHKPLSEFYVSAYKQSFQSEATTDSNGTARLRLSPGDYQVTAANQSTSGYRRSVKVETGRTNRIEIEVTHPHKISGIVRMPDGGPAAGVAVRIIVSHGPGMADIKTDTDGKFDLGMISHLFEAYGSKKYLLVRDVEHNLAVAQEIDEDRGPFDLKLAPAMTLAGRAESGGKTITNVTAKLVFWTEHVGRFLQDVAKTNISGHYEIPALPPGGKYGVVVAAPGYGEKNVPEFKAATEAIRQELETVELKPANLRIAGQVLDVDDMPVANSSVNLSGREQPLTSVRTDREGRFSFEHTCEGSAMLTASFNNSGGYIYAKGGDTNVVLRLEPKP